MNVYDLSKFSPTQIEEIEELYENRDAEIEEEESGETVEDSGETEEGAVVEEGEATESPPESMTDRAGKRVAVMAGAFIRLPFDIIRTFSNRTAADIAPFSRNLFKVSFILLILSAVSLFLNFQRFLIVDPMSAVIACIALSVIGFILQSKFSDVEDSGEEQEDTEVDSETGAEEEEQEDEMDESFERPETEDIENVREYIENLVEEIEPVEGVFSRRYLLNQFKYLLPNCTEDFANITKYTPADVPFKYFHLTLNKALRITFKKKYPGVVYLDSVTETFSSFVVRVEKEGNLGSLDTQDIYGKINSIVEYFMEDYDEVGEEPKRVMVFVKDQGEYVSLTFRKTDATKIVTLNDVLGAKKILSFFQSEKTIMPIALGIRQNNSVMSLDLFDYPHALIMGGTGGGKSWLTSLLITTLCAFNPPSRVSLIILDPKDSPELNPFKEMPHTAIFNGNVSDFVSILQLVQREAERRKGILHEHNVDIKDYWKIWKEGMHVLPELIVVIDELNSLEADLEEDDHKELKKLITYFCVKCRAYGIKILGIPQRPLNKIIEKTAKENMKLKIAFEITEEASEFMFGMKNTGLKLSGKGECGVATSPGDKPEQLRAVALAPDSQYQFEIIKATAKIWWKLNPPLPEMPAFTRFMTRKDLSLTIPEPTSATFQDTYKPRETRLSKEVLEKPYVHPGVRVSTFRDEVDEVYSEEDTVEVDESYEDVEQEGYEDSEEQYDEETQDEVYEDEETQDEVYVNKDLDIEIDFEDLPQTTVERSENPKQSLSKEVISKLDYIEKLKEVEDKETDEDGYTRGRSIEYDDVDGVEEEKVDGDIDTEASGEVADEDLRKYYQITVHPLKTKESNVTELFSRQPQNRQPARRAGQKEDVRFFEENFEGVRRVSPERIKRVGDKYVTLKVCEYVAMKGSVSKDELYQVFQEEEIDYSREQGEIVYNPRLDSFTTFYS